MRKKQRVVSKSLKRKSEAIKKVIRMTTLLNIIIFAVVLIGVYVWLAKFT